MPTDDRKNHVKARLDHARRIAEKVEKYRKNDHFGSRIDVTDL
jgi:hypothetical protein